MPDDSRNDDAAVIVVAIDPNLQHKPIDDLLQDATDLTVLPRLVRFLYARRQPPLAKMYPEGPAI